MISLVDEAKDGGLQFGDGPEHAALEALAREAGSLDNLNWRT
jgi:hypothetical protein